MASKESAEDSTSPVATQARVAKSLMNKTHKAIEKRAVALKQLKITYMEPGALKPNPWNPNRQSDHDFNLLIKSMSEDGFTQPVVCVQLTEEHFAEDARLKREVYSVGDVMIVDGEHRWRAGTTLGYPEIPVVVTGMTVAQMRIATLRHNRARGSEDVELAADVLRDLRALGALEWAQDSLMLDDLELSRMLEDIPAPEALAGEQFERSWVPGEQNAPANSVTASQSEDGRAVAASTPAAIEAARKAESAMAEAKTEEERQKAKLDNRVFRVSLVFAGDESEIVKAVLGDKPAVKLVELCRKEIEARQEGS